MRTRINNEIYDVEPGVMVELFQLDLKGKGTYYFHAGENGFKTKLVFGGIGYDFIPITATGFEYVGDGRLPRPSLTVSNYMGFMSIKALHFDDFIGHKFTRIKTFIRFLDNENFPNNLNPFGIPDSDEAFAVDEFYVNQKTQENKNVMEFELVSIMELEGVSLPARRIMSNYCSWLYRSTIGCGYTDKPVADFYNKKIQDGGYQNTADIGGSTFLGGDALIKNGDGSLSIITWNPGSFYDRGQVVEVLPHGYDPETKPPSMFVCLSNSTRSNPETDTENWVKDSCSNNVIGCRIRHGQGAPQAREIEKGLPFGAFPGVARYDFEQ
jgi:lambda family phage minor tail protein L